MPPSRHGNALSGTFGSRLSTIFDYSTRNDSPSKDMPSPLRKSPSPPADTRGSSSPPPVNEPKTRWSGDSLLERHAIASYHSQTLQRPPSLSVYELPTATYMWPRLDLARPSHQPRLYVKYRPSQDDSDMSRSSSETSAHSSPLSELARCFTPPPPTGRKRSSSAESDPSSDDARSPSDRFLKHRSRGRRSNSNRAGKRRLQSTLRMLGLESEDSGVDSRDVSVDPTAHQSNSGHAVAHGSTAPVAVNGRAPSKQEAARTSASPENDPMKDEWMKYIRPHPERNPGPDYKCTWITRGPNGESEECMYSSKKHLVKRHIESKHLQLRPCICPICGKGFAQKSNLETHINTHTGRAPHQCNYCEKRFKDPARRHRHMTDDHSHVPSRTKKGRMTAEVPPSSVGSSPAAGTSGYER
ncbi:hypothetical protein NUW54_g10804 [Trametes sanguinea]|uniref:Uncharacterized protein n=1 Tax=Trametes sanguinea TaxID=158606 RepID=A0ACC1NT68_9APHY|nr:hypothetical protein NUW54_g10804 [Trametes sanguinea]